MPQDMMVTCPGCDGVVSVSPTGDEAEVRCPKCDEVVYTRNAQGIEWWANVPVADPTVEESTLVPIEPPTSKTPRRIPSEGPTTPDWREPAGWVALILGVVAFIASYNAGPRQAFEHRVLQALMNPLFFIGVPLGVHWLRTVRSQRPNSPPRRIEPAPEIQEDKDFAALGCAVVSLGSALIFWLAYINR